MAGAAAAAAAVVALPAFNTGGTGSTSLGSARVEVVMALTDEVVEGKRERAAGGIASSVTGASMDKARNMTAQAVAAAAVAVVWVSRCEGALDVDDNSSAISLLHNIYFTKITMKMSRDRVG
jgi:hypothetical protein